MGERVRVCVVVGFRERMCLMKGSRGCVRRLPIMNRSQGPLQRDAFLPHRLLTPPIAGVVPVQNVVVAHGSTAILRPRPPLSHHLGTHAAAVEKVGV